MLSIILHRLGMRQEECCRNMLEPETVFSELKRKKKKGQRSCSEMRREWLEVMGSAEGGKDQIMIMLGITE